ncbi:hypothetical protein PEC302110_33970 [Pectobacterium araliae]|uniref:Uncharacterized protein n=1 Tax=Pectobacterium araliae TaxID=3073862 RepID=A0AAN0KCX4_9GAMM|nr:hypothetical protein PEC302110_33970 [Pectobacterium sp. MAFF 302110]
MATQVINAIAVVSAAVLFYYVACTQAILHNKQWLLIAVIQFVQQEAQAFGVDLPAPFGGSKVWVRNQADDIAA